MMVHLRTHCVLLLVASMGLAISTASAAGDLATEKIDTVELRPVDVQDQRSLGPVVTRLDDVQNGVIYAAKKTELVPIAELTANTSANNARQAFAGVAGLNIWESDAAGVQLSIGGRGLSPDRTINFTTRQNGYEISADPLGYPESYYTPPFELVDHIEIVRGGGALRYGTQYGGMVNFLFRQPDRGAVIDARGRVTMGSFGFLSTFADLNGGNADVAYHAAYQYKHSDGWRPNSGLDMHTFYAALRTDVSERLSVTADCTFMTFLAQQPGGLTDAQFAADPSVSIRERNWFTVDWNLASVRFDYALGDSTSIRSLFFGNFSGRQSVGSLESINKADPGGPRVVADGTYRNIGNETTITHDLKIFENISTFVAGFRLFHGTTTQAQGVGSSGSDANFSFIDTVANGTSDYTTPNFNAAVFAEGRIDLGRGVSLVPGIRLEHIVSSAEGWYRTGDSTYTEDYSLPRTFLLGGMGISWKFTQEQELYANAVQNYRSITFPDLRITNPSMVVDPDLKDSRGYTLDLGVRGVLADAMTFDISGFYVRANDRIGDIAQGTSILRTNVADAYTTGLEAMVDVGVTRLLEASTEIPSVHVMINGSMISSAYMSSQNPALDGKDVEYVPPYTVRTSLILGWKGIGMSLLASWVGQQYSDASNAESTPTAVAGIIPAYQVWDLSASYTMDWFRIEASCNNLLGESYFTRRARGYPGPGIIPAEPRSVFLTIQANGDLITGKR